MKKADHKRVGAVAVALAASFWLSGHAAEMADGSKTRSVEGPVAEPATVPQSAPLTDKASDSQPGAHNEARAAEPARMTLEQLKAQMAAAEKRRQEALKPDPAAPNRELAEQWGVEVIGISHTAGGYMLDFRFRVLDVDKALPLFDHRIKPYITAEKSGINLPVPVGTKTGAMRPTNRGKNIKADKTYYMVFANPDTHLKTGDKVAVVIGDFRVEHLTVN